MVEVEQACGFDVGDGGVGHGLVVDDEVDVAARERCLEPVDEAESVNGLVGDDEGIFLVVVDQRRRCHVD